MKRFLKISVVITFFLLGTLFFPLYFGGCELFGILTEEQAGEIVSDSMSAVSKAIANALSEGLVFKTLESQPGQLSSKSTRMLEDLNYTIDYSGNGVDVSGSYDFSMSDDGTIEINYSLDIDFSNYSTSDIVLDGEISYGLEVAGSSISGDMTGNYDATYNSNVYNFIWDFTISSSSVSGNYSVNGTSYDWSGSAPDVNTEDNNPGGDSVTGAYWWTDEDGGDGWTLIYLEGSHIGTLSSHFTSGSPSYGDNGTVSIPLSPGTYSYHAETTGGHHTWDYDFTVTEGKTTSICLVYD
jgi:hypothetical protein